MTNQLSFADIIPEITRHTIRYYSFLKAAQVELSIPFENNSPIYPDNITAQDVENPAVLTSAGTWTPLHTLSAPTPAKTPRFSRPATH